jgi:hypothetical protein
MGEGRQGRRKPEIPGANIQIPDKLQVPILKLHLFDPDARLTRLV